MVQDSFTCECDDSSTMLSGCSTGSIERKDLIRLDVCQSVKVEAYLHKRRELHHHSHTCQQGSVDIQGVTSHHLHSGTSVNMNPHLQHFVRLEHLINKSTCRPI